MVLPLKDFNLVMETKNPTNKIVFQWSIQNINKLPSKQIRSSRFSLVPGQLLDWEMNIGIQEDNTLQISLAFHSHLDTVPVLVESNATLLKDEGSVAARNCLSTNVFYGGDERVLLSRVEFPEPKKDKITFYCSMTVHGYDLDCSRNFYIDDGFRNVEELRKDYLNMMKLGEFADVKIKVGNKCFSAHRCVLEHLAPGFFSEHKNEILEGEVSLLDETPEIFESVLQNIYGGKVNQLAIAQDFKQLYTMANRYKLRGLLWQCSREIIFNMREDNVHEFYELARRHHDKKLEEYCDAFKKDNR